MLLMSRLNWVLRAKILGFIYPNFDALYLGKPLLLSGIRRISLGSGVGIFPGARIEVHKRGALVIGSNTKIGHGFFVDCSGNVEIGSETTLSSNVHISTQKYRWPDIHKEGFKGAQDGVEDVQIGSGVFVGINVVIMPGVQIADGCVIGANSIVTKSLTEKTIYKQR